MRDRKPYRLFYKPKIYDPKATSQEEWIKLNVRKNAQTQCTKCGKWISKYWRDGCDINHVMTKCGPCYNENHDS